MNIRLSAERYNGTFYTNRSSDKAFKGKIEQYADSTCRTLAVLI